MKKYISILLVVLAFNVNAQVQFGGTTNLTRVGGNNIDLNIGNASSGSPRVVIASDQPPVQSNINQIGGASLSLGQASGTASIPVVPNSESANGTITTQNLVPFGTATAGSAVAMTLRGNTGFTVQVTGTYTGALSLQVTLDNSTWITVGANCFFGEAAGAISTTIASAAVGVFQVKTPSAALQARITGLAAMTGTATVFMRASNSGTLIDIVSPLPGGTNSIGNIGTVTTVTGLTTVSNGQTAHSTASTGSPFRVGARVAKTTLATKDQTLVADDASDVGITTDQQLIVKENAASDFDFNFIFSSASTVTSVQTLVQASGTAGIRNYIKSFRLSTDALGAAGNVWILDGALTISSIAITTGLVTTSAAHDLKIGDAIVFTALAAGTGVTANTLYYVTSVGSTTTFNFSTTIGGSNVVPSVAYTGTTGYRILDQIRVQTTALPPTLLTNEEPIRGAANTPMNILIPTSLTSGSIYITVNGYRGI